MAAMVAGGARGEPRNEYSCQTRRKGQGSRSSVAGVAPRRVECGPAESGLRGERARAATDGVTSEDGAVQATMLHDDARMTGTPAGEVAVVEANTAAGIGCSLNERQAADVGSARVPRGEGGVQRQELSVAVNDHSGVKEQVGVGPSGNGQGAVVDMREVLEGHGKERCGIADKADLDVNVSAQSKVVQAAYKSIRASQDRRRAGARTGDDGEATPQTLQMALGAEMIAHDVVKAKELMTKDQAEVDASAVASEEAQRLRKRRKRLEHSKARRPRGKERQALTVSSPSKAEATTESVQGLPQGTSATMLDDKAAMKRQRSRTNRRFEKRAHKARAKEMREQLANLAKMAQHEPVYFAFADRSSRPRRRS